MAEYILKDSRGKEQTFADDKIFVQGTDGELVQFTMGTGGSASADLHYVTFMSYDGLTEYGKKAVADGDDCADPIVRGIFDTPTRESDVQYNYTFSGGWSTDPNGAADADWNKAVTEDKVVYAVFTSSVRYYTITYYDSDGTTVLKKESKAYGSKPSYTPEKDGYLFIGWTPELAAVTGDASYIAQFEESVTFAAASWEKIAEKSADGTASQTWTVGDTKEIALTGGYGTITVAIAGFNHDDLADGSGKAGITLVCTVPPILTTAWQTNGTQVLYSDSDVHKRLTKTATYNALYLYMPSELQKVLKNVNKVIDASYESGTTTTENLSAKLWALSLDEIGDTSGTYIKLGDKYDLFTSQKIVGAYGFNLPISWTDAGGTKMTAFWLRGTRRAGVARPHYCEPYGSTDSIFEFGTTATLTKAYHLVFGFCV